MSNIHMVLISVVLGLTILTDVRYHRIPNILLMVILAVNFLFVETSGFDLRDLCTTEGMLIRIGYVALIGLFLFPFFSVGAIGAGDLKLIVVVALAVKNPVVYCFMVFALGAVWGLIKLIAAGEFNARMRYAYDYFHRLFLFRQVTEYVPQEIGPNMKKSYSVHLSVPVFLALLTGRLLEII